MLVPSEGFRDADGRYPRWCVCVCPLFSCTAVPQAVVAIVVSAIQAFSNMVTIVNRACLVLHNIALDPGHLSALVAIGAPEELLHAIGKHPTDALLIQCATGTLRRLGR